MVRLLRTQKPCQFDAILCFNPTMVRLLPFTFQPEGGGCMSFNPTMVRLLHFAQRRAAVDSLFGFNPTMVRLLLSKSYQIIAFATKFQSHNGAIAALHQHPIHDHDLQFQSHNGAIAA